MHAHFCTSKDWYHYWCIFLALKIKPEPFNIGFGTV